MGPKFYSLFLTEFGIFESFETNLFFQQKKIPYIYPWDLFEFFFVELWKVKIITSLKCIFEGNFLEKKLGLAGSKNI